ncbi:MAG: hypothetical protein MI865_05905 [Proteobacteria bacterium]|nr:hypothetical protein [Pseudomonadota bacterium]
MNTPLDRIAGNTIIQFTDVDPALLKADAIVEEQDTNMVLGKSHVVMNTIESFPALVKKMEQQTREIPGSVIIKSSKPKRFIAVIYDVDHDPICERVWLETALETILADCDQYKIKTLAMPAMGTSYGKIDEDEFTELLQNTLMNKRRKDLKKILIYKTIDEPES